MTNIYFEVNEKYIIDIYKDGYENGYSDALKQKVKVKSEKTIDDIINMLTDIQLEMEEEKIDTENLHYYDLENAESINTGIDMCIDTIQNKIDELKAESEE